METPKPPFAEAEEIIAEIKALKAERNPARATPPGRSEGPGTPLGASSVEGSGT